MIIVRLQISGFLSYNEKAIIDFTSFDLACISGANGAGKSTLLEAITWALFGEARRRDDAIINTHSQTAEVILDFDYEGLRYQVQRSKTRDKSTLLELRIQTPEQTWKPLTEATMRNTEERIRSLLHMDYETFINASFFLQGKADQFAQQRPGDRKRILSTILGLEMWETYREETNRRRKAHEAEITIIDARLEEIEAELKQEETRKKRLSELETDLKSRQELANLRKTLLDQNKLLTERYANERTLLYKQKAEIDQQQAELERLRNELEERKSDHSAYLTQMENEPAVREEVKAWENARQELTRWEKIATKFHEYDNQRQDPLLRIEGERVRLQTEISNLLIVSEQMTQLNVSLPALQKQVTNLTVNVTGLSEQVKTKPELENQMRELQDNRAHARAENHTLDTEMKDLESRRNLLMKAEQAQCPTCEKPLEEDEQDILVKEITALGTEKGDKFRLNTKSLNEWESELKKVETSLRQLEQVEVELKNQQRQLDSRSEELTNKQKEFTSWQEDGANHLNQLRQLLDSGKYAAEAKAELAAIELTLKELGYDAAAHEDARVKEETYRESREKLSQVESAKAALAEVEREINGIEKTLQTSATRLSTLVSEHTQAKEQFEQETKDLADVNRLENEYYDAQEAVNHTLSELGYTRNQVEVLDKQRELKTIKIEEREQLLGKAAQLKILERAFSKDGIPALLIEQAIPEIQKNANEILDRLSAGGLSVTIETQREFKDKKRDDKRETLDILIRDSAGERPYELFSGGEAFRVNFAIRLALSRVLSSRAGARLQTLVIDEGFGSQDTDGRQRLIEAINLARNDFAKVLVITHLEELKDAFSARIEVTKTSAGSAVQVVAA